jgi:hypothetical protein
MCLVDGECHQANCPFLCLSAFKSSERNLRRIRQRLSFRDKVTVRGILLETER